MKKEASNYYCRINQHRPQNKKILLNMFGRPSKFCIPNYTLNQDVKKNRKQSWENTYLKPKIK